MRNILECQKVVLPRSRYKASSQWEKYSEELYEVLIGIDTGLSYNYDYAIDYLEIAFIGQCFSEVGEILDYDEINKDGEFCVALLIRCSDNNAIEELTTGLCQHLGICTNAFNCDKCEEDECRDCNERSEDFADHFADFQDAIDHFEKCPALPYYCDKYFGNYLVSDNFDENYDSNISEHPEWAYTTWRSAWSLKLGFDLYVSEKYWILPSDADICMAMRVASDYCPDTINFIEPNYVFSDTYSLYISTQGDIIRIPIGLHYRATQCARHVFPLDDPQQNAEHYWGISGSFSITPDLSVLSFGDETFQYVMFRDCFEVMSRRQIDGMAAGTRRILADFLAKGTTGTASKCEWTDFDDEKFELLCYELIQKDGRYIRDKTKKMGKARSRDGGRDVIAEMASHAGQEQRAGRQWIFQCKFSKKDRSLGRNDVQLPQLIDEYQPTGVTIVTNVLIDSGAYDSYERIAKNRKVQIEFWDGLKIDERVYLNPDLHNKYWGQ